ncbi:hypothetical protein C0995_013562 [Termitomyces sp. Mi166|nr:hypothetical protein C0995_013562 [Termitomyces sp. Mi166\
MEQNDVRSLDKLVAYREAWGTYKRRDLGKDIVRRTKEAKSKDLEVDPEVQIIGEVIDIDDEGSSEEEDNLREADSETNGQLCEDSDNGNDTEALVKGLGFPRAEFLEKWKKISKTAHDSIEWRNNHPNPCTRCKTTSCEFAHSGTPSCIKCVKNRKVCSVRIDYIVDKMAQIHGSSNKWISRAVARNWHKNSRMRSRKHSDGTGPSRIKISPQKVNDKSLSASQRPDLKALVAPFTQTHRLMAKLPKPGGDRYSTLPIERRGNERTISVLEIEDQLQRANGGRDEEGITIGNPYKEGRFEGEIWGWKQGIGIECDQLTEARRYERQQELSPDHHGKKTPDDSRYEIGISTLPFASQKVKVAGKEKGTGEKDGLKVKMKTVELIAKEKQRELEEINVLAKEAESKRQKAEKDAENVARIIKEAEKTADEAKKRLNEITLAIGDAEARIAKAGDTSQSTKDSPSIPSHRTESQLQSPSLTGIKFQRQMDYAKGTEALEKETNYLEAPLENLMHVRRTEQKAALVEKVSELGSKDKSVGDSPRSKLVDSSTAWWRSVALFNQFQINLMEHERFTLSRGLGEYLERLKSLRDQTTSSLELDPLLRHELNITTESSASTATNNQVIFDKQEIVFFSRRNTASKLIQRRLNVKSGNLRKYDTKPETPKLCTSSPG